jgi:hypothetical protein
MNKIEIKILRNAIKTKEDMINNYMEMNGDRNYYRKIVDLFEDITIYEKLILDLRLLDIKKTYEKSKI